MTPRVLVTCEHAVNTVPDDLRARFRGHASVLRTHRAWDPGAEEAAAAIARRLAAPLLLGRCTRLVVDLNRTITAPDAFSEFTRGLPGPGRARIAGTYWRPFRAQAENLAFGAGPVAHISVHTFTPVLDGAVRDMDVAWLYDPARPGEVGLVNAWMRAFRRARPRLRLARNRPYKGTADGHTTALRAVLPDRRYAGIELEVNHGLLAKGGAWWTALCADLASTLGDALGRA